VCHYKQITYKQLRDNLSDCAAAELCMAAQATFMDEVHAIRELRYTWAEDGTLLLTLDCHNTEEVPGMSYRELQKRLGSLCQWQLTHEVVIGLRHALAEVVTLYHAFEVAHEQHHTLMLVCTPPDEYFEAIAAA
jgi:hypothetical protein